jgi:aryl-alcohol dehydrogenase-like predicted oxidoreductase
VARPSATACSPRTTRPEKVSSLATRPQRISSTILDLAEDLQPIAERHGVTAATLAVAWTLSFPGVTGAIAGARRPGQVEGWLPAATLELKEDDLADIAAAVDATGAGSGPASPPLTPPRVTPGNGSGMGSVGVR